MVITGTVNDDSLTGTGGNDQVDMSQGGVDTVSGGLGDDSFDFGRKLSSKDKIDGGDGFDTLILDGDYSTELKFKAANLVGIELLTLRAGHDYTLTIVDANAAPGAFKVDASQLGASDSLVFNGADDTDCRITVTGGAGDDVITSGDGGSFLQLLNGGHDTCTGGDGDDDYIMVGSFDPLDSIDGKDGDDLLGMTGDYSAGLTITGAMMKHIETLGLFGSDGYDLTLQDAVVAAGAVMSVTAVSLFGDAKVDGSAEKNGAYAFIGGYGDDTFIGGRGADSFDMGERASADLVAGGDGDDSFDFGALMGEDDIVEGGDGTDSMTLNGDYSAGLTFKSGMMKEVERLVLTGAYDYDLVSKNATVVAGAVMEVNSVGVDVTNHLIFDGSDEDNGSFVFRTGTGDDTIQGGQLGDEFHFDDPFGGAGDDYVMGEGGQDVFYMGSHLTAADRIDGGSGLDIVEVGSLAAPLQLAADTLTGIEALIFDDSLAFDVTLDDANVAAGETLIVISQSSNANHVLVFDGSAETDGMLALDGGDGDDSLTGGALDDSLVGGDGQDSLSGLAGLDTIEGGGKGDQLTGGSGATTFVYRDVSDSTGFYIDFDHITQLKPRLDHFDMDVTVTAVDAKVTTGHLDWADVRLELPAAIGAAELGAHHAVVFKPDSGDLAGHIFLIVDADGVAGYSPDDDYVIEIDQAASNLNQLTPAFFI